MFQLLSYQGNLLLIDLNNLVLKSSNMTLWASTTSPSSETRVTLMKFCRSDRKFNQNQVWAVRLYRSCSGVWRWMYDWGSQGDVSWHHHLKHFHTNDPVHEDRHRQCDQPQCLKKQNRKVCGILSKVWQTKVNMRMICSLRNLPLLLHLALLLEVLEYQLT